RNEQTLLLGSSYVEPFAPVPGSEEYLAEHQAVDTSGMLIEMQGERPSYKNDTAIRPINSRSLDVTPYDTSRLLLNTLGGENWDLTGSTVYYEFTVPESGMYLITLRALQDVKNNFTVFRRITINDEVLFAELNETPFYYSTSWSN